MSAALALASLGVWSLGCGGDDTTPDCSSPEAGCGTVIGDGTTSPVDATLDVQADTNPAPTPDANVPDTGEDVDANAPDAHDAGDAHEAHEASDAHDSGHDAHGYSAPAISGRSG